MPLSEDEIIRRRLINDGDSGQEDKRIASILKLIIELSNVSSTDEDKSIVLCNRLQTALAQHEAAMRKTVNVISMNAKEEECYKALEADFDNQIVSAQERTKTLKEELKAAKEIRRKKQECDLLANVVEQLPDRLLLESQLNSVQQKLSQLQDSESSLTQKLEARKRQFYLLSLTLHELDKMLDDEQDGAQLPGSL